MNCQLFNHKIDDYLDGLLQAAERHNVQRHVEVCSRCAAVLEQENRLRRELRGLPVPPPSPGFTARALRQARVSQTRPRQRRMVAAALAATLLLGIGIGKLGDQGPAQLAEVNLQLDEPSALNLAFNSPRDFEGATFVMALPAGVELVNYPGQREITWQADLKTGRNLLTLPLVARNENGGMVLAELRHGNEIKRFVLHVGVQVGNDRHTSVAPVTPT